MCTSNGGLHKSDFEDLDSVSQAVDLAPANKLIEQLLSAAQQSHAEELARERRIADMACKSLHRKIHKLEARLQHSESTYKASAGESQARAVERQPGLKFLEQRVAERDVLIADLKERSKPHRGTEIGWQRYTTC